MEDPAQQSNEYDTAENERTSLDMNPEGLRELSERASVLVTNYFATISDLPVFPDTRAEEVAAQMVVNADHRQPLRMQEARGFAANQAG